MKNVDKEYVKYRVTGGFAVYWQIFVLPVQKLLTLKTSDQFVDKFYGDLAPASVASV